MSAAFNTFLLFTLQVTAILSALPPIQKCPMSDSDCLKKSAQIALPTFAAGIQEVGTESLEPILIDVINIDLSGLKLTVNDVDIKGLGKSTVEKVKFDTAKKVLLFDFNVAPITLKGKYTASGQLLILPINGQGDITIKIAKLDVHMKMPYDIVKTENGKDAIDLKSYKFTYENKVNTHFKLTNLFNGNGELSTAMHTFMNENWQAISNEFATPMLERPLQKIFTAIKIYLRSQPLEDIVNV